MDGRMGEEWVCIYYGAWAGVSALKHPDRTLALGSVGGKLRGGAIYGGQARKGKKKKDSHILGTAKRTNSNRYLVNINDAPPPFGGATRHNERIDNTPPTNEKKEITCDSARSGRTRSRDQW